MRVAHVHPAALAAHCERLGLPARQQLAPASPVVRDASLWRDLYGVSWCSEVDDDPLKRGEVLASLIVALQTRHAKHPAALPRVGNEPELVRAAKRRLREDLAAKLTLPALAQELRTTPFVLLRAFVRHEGLSPHAYLQQARVREAVRLLRAGRPIVQAGIETGFADQAHFTRVFKQVIGVTPKVFRSALV